MKPIILVPPAQAEALSDTQDDLRSGDFGVRQPWRDDEAIDDLFSDEMFSYETSSRPRNEPLKAPLSNAQLWPSSANSSR